MKISCVENNTNCILNLHSKILSSELILKLKKILESLPKNKQIALNLEEVDYICIEFLDFLKEFSKQKKLALTNLQTEIFVLLNLTKHDKFAHIFLNDTDFIEHKRGLLNRRFSILECSPSI